MSATVQCDNCKAVEPVGAESLTDWLHVGWGVGRSVSGISSDYCTYVCAEQGLRKWAEEDAEAALAQNDEGEAAS